MTPKEQFEASFRFSLGPQWIVVIRLRSYLLSLVTPFGTSHSSTTQRKNALIKISLHKHEANRMKGYGEIGLPPKKPSAGYLADFHDVVRYFVEYTAWVEQMVKEKGLTHCSHNPFQSFEGSAFFKGIAQRNDTNDAGSVCTFLLECLDSCPMNSDVSSTFPRNGIEGAILDLWAQFVKKPLYLFITESTELPKAVEKSNDVLLGRSFYTVSLNSDINVMVNEAKRGAKNTPFLKIKLDGDQHKGESIIHRLVTVLSEELPEKKWELAIDANGAWTPDIALYFLHHVFSQYEGKIFMLEQPFATDIFKNMEAHAAELEDWKKVLSEYRKANIQIFADESVSTAEDLPKLKEYVSGVNIKLEKAGGFRSAVRAIQVASELGMMVWIGMMVGSQLSCSMGCHLLPLACASDLDCGLLVNKASQLFKGGFKWGADRDYGTLTFSSSLTGVGVKRKKKTEA